MVPLVATRAELAIIRALIERTAEAVFAEKGASVDYLVGTMIELPRAALAAGDIAERGRILQLRHQRPHPDRSGRQPRRCRPLPHRLCRKGHLRPRSLRQPRRRGRRRADRDRGGAGQGGPARPQARHLRRAWRRPRQHRLLRERSASITSAPRPTACRSPAWRRRRRRCEGKRGELHWIIVMPDLIRHPPSKRRRGTKMDPGSSPG